MRGTALPCCVTPPLIGIAHPEAQITRASLNARSFLHGDG